MVAVCEVLAVPLLCFASRTSTRNSARPPGSRWPDVAARARYSASCIRPGSRRTEGTAATVEELFIETLVFFSELC